MFEQLKEITVKGGPFTEYKSLGLFPKQLNVLYGRNGSGKSTIAKCINNIGKDDETDRYQIIIPHMFSSEYLKRIFVFDEDFVAKNVQMEQDGLSTVVMLGQQIGLSEQLKIKQNEKTKLLTQKESLVLQQEQLDDSSNKESLVSLFNQIKKHLQVDGGWADRDKQIKGNVYKSQVTQNLVSELMGMNITFQAFSKLKKKYDEKFALYQKVRTGEQKFNLLPVNVIKENFKSLLEQKIESPILSSRDKEIIDFVLSQHSDILQRIHPIFDNSGMAFCPLCLRPISQEEKEDLFDKVKSFFNKDTENYKRDLQINIDRLSQWNSNVLPPKMMAFLGEKMASDYMEASMELQKVYSRLQIAFQHKMENIYGIHTYFDEWNEFEEKQSNYTSLLERINSILDQYNKDFDKKEQLKNELIEINKKVEAFRELPSLQAYQTQLKKYAGITDSLRGINLQIENIEGDISSIYSKISQTSIALKFMNDALAYIFFDKNRMTLEYVDGKYALKSHGKDVKLKNVSTGERNAISLCYFFAKCFENHGKDDCYTDEMLVVLDDPVTSFDKDNKVGIMSFLRWQVSEIYKGHSNSKVLIMSHDLSVAFQIQKMYKDINSSAYSFIELRHGELVNKEGKRTIKNEYQLLMDDVFAIANGSSNDISSVGNKMRKLEEAYSTFIANTGFAKLLHNIDFLKKVPSEKRMFYQNFMSRLVLNTESHTEEKVYDLNDFTPMFDEEEIRKTARYLLMLFNYVDKFHLKSYLKEKMAIIEEWVKDEHEFDE